MTHKYLTQIRTIPNYHEDQSEFAKAWRKVNYSFKSASSLIIKNKKTRIITSVLAVYMVLTSGFVVAFINVDNNQANAQSVVAKDNVSIVIKKDKIENNNLVLNLEVQNKTGQTIVNPIFKFQSSFENLNWVSATNDIDKSDFNSQNNEFRLSNISPNQKTIYKVYSTLSNPNVENIAVDARVSFNLEGQLTQVNSPKYLIEIR